MNSSLADPWWHEAVWHDFILSGLGAAVVAGLFAVLVARLTVAWTTEGTRKVGRRQRSHMAAEALTRALGDYASDVMTAAPGRATDRAAFLFAIALEGPVLDDVEVFTRVQELSDLLTDYSDWSASVVKRPSEEDAAFADRYVPVLMARVSWVMQSLACHRVDRPLPDRNRLADLPQLPDADGTSQPD